MVELCHADRCMITGIAISLPIILAVMGVVVTIRPVSREGTWHWISIGAFVLAGVLAVVIGIADRHNSDNAQQELKDTVKGLKDSIDQLTKPVPQKSQLPSRDPDSLYQNENIVGKVVGARITLNDSKVYFDQIENSGNLDTKKNFEYRDYVLHFIRADAFIGMLVQAPGGVATNVYQRVVCEIVGRVH